MRIDVFGRTCVSKKTGKPFIVYSAKLKNKNDEEVFVNVKFKSECGQPMKVPCTIVVNKEDCNLATKTERYTDNTTQEEKEVTKCTLWVSKFNEEVYIDTSLDDIKFD